MPILDNLLSAFGLERKARGAVASNGVRARVGAGAIPLSGWSAGYGYSGGYGSTSPVPSPFADTVPWHLNPVVAAGIAWFARNFPVPDLHVVRDGGADDGAEVDGHDLPKLFDKPNELWSFFDFFAASVMSDITDGNTFWLKRKDGKGAVVDLWWLEPWGVRIMADPTRQKAVLGYRYDSGDVHADYRPDEILHVRAAQPDRVDPRRGMSPLSPVDRSIRVTTELCRYDEAILKNGGASPGVFVPPDPKQPIPKEDIPGLQAWYRQNATGPNAGGPIFAPFGMNFLKTGFSPEEMSLDKLPRRHVSFILAALGLSPMVLGYEDESKTYANFAEACRSAYENALMPMQARFAEAINHDDDLVAEGERLKWDYAHVTYLQDDRAAKIHSLVEAVGGPILTQSEARAELHYEPLEEPEPPAQPPPMPGADGTDGAADGSAVPAGIAALLAARGGGSGKPPANGKVPAGTAAAATKANPHHDHAGRFAHGSGSGGAPLPTRTGSPSHLEDDAAAGRLQPWEPAAAPPPPGSSGSDLPDAETIRLAGEPRIGERPGKVPAKPREASQALRRVDRALGAGKEPDPADAAIFHAYQARDAADRARSFRSRAYVAKVGASDATTVYVDHDLAFRPKPAKILRAFGPDGKEIPVPPPHSRPRGHIDRPAYDRDAEPRIAGVYRVDQANPVFGTPAFPNLDPATGRDVRAGKGSRRRRPAPPTDATLARRTEAVLVALEAKLLGGRSRKANPHHDAAGRFAHGSGGGGGSGGAPVGPRVTQEEADAARLRLADMASSGGEYSLELGPPETARDHRALEKADAAGKSVVVRTATTPEVRAETDGDVTRHLVAEQLVVTVMPHPEKPDRWVAREHGTDARGGHDDHELRSRERADRQAEAVVRSWVKGSSSTKYAAASRLERVNFESHEVGEGYRVNFRVLVPAGEPSAKGATGVAVIDGIEVPVGDDGAGGPQP